MGIMALYGGRKGHGFWIYKTSITHAQKMAHEFNPRDFADFSGHVIMNDGVKSGNTCFWMFADVEKLILKNADGVTAKGYKIQWNELWNKWQVSHPEIGATLAEFDYLNFLGALEYCHKG